MKTEAEGLGISVGRGGCSLGGDARLCCCATAVADCRGEFPFIPSRTWPARPGAARRQCRRNCRLLEVVPAGPWKAEVTQRGPAQLLLHPFPLQETTLERDKCARKAKRGEVSLESQQDTH